jgi:hypothetical protein
MRLKRRKVKAERLKVGKRISFNSLPTLPWEGIAQKAIAFYFIY